MRRSAGGHSKQEKHKHIVVKVCRWTISDRRGTDYGELATSRKS